MRNSPFEQPDTLNVSMKPVDTEKRVNSPQKEWHPALTDRWMAVGTADVVGETERQGDVWRGGAYLLVSSTGPQHPSERAQPRPRWTTPRLCLGCANHGRCRATAAINSTLTRTPTSALAFDGAGAPCRRAFAQLRRCATYHTPRRAARESVARSVHSPRLPRLLRLHARCYATTTNTR
jgi:hypothetical protein